MSGTDRDRVVSLFDVDDVTEFGHVRDFIVTRIPFGDVEEFCKRWHYAGGRGHVNYAYGLWDGPIVVGVVTYNIPSPAVARAIFGDGHSMWVAHMGRLVCAEGAPRNSESRLIAGSLRLLVADRPPTRAVVTFAAMSQGHIGYVYQATNALYTGMGGHGRYYSDGTVRRSSRRTGGSISQTEAISRGWTVHHELQKHRYVYLLGSKTERKEARALLKFPVLPYPKEAQS